MSRKTILSRPRTRLYDANYNIGESYYKPALDRLDRKYSGRPLSPPPRNSFGDIADRHARIFADEDLDISRRRAEKHIKDENLFDSRGARIGQRAAIENFENDVNDETSATLKRIRASKKVSMIDDVDLDGISNNLKSHRLLDRSEKILDSVGLNDSPRRAIENGTSSYKRKALKVTFDGDANDELDKWTPIENVRAVKARQQEQVTSVRARREDASASIRSDTSAAMRARQTKERITDIEDEMAAMAEKQAAREARVARLRALVAETEQESEAFEVAQAAIERRSARREKLQD
ncbi:uncharacterized protein LOC108910445 [Anoplophora glabripennis]|nr:uncharacterized protein LOC108910445 [Anoplophora glabripennis]XP_018570560.1 uncharacterized protein LOC108910445 [Anoplophora glabripennis]